MEAAQSYTRDELENKKYSELQKIGKALGIKGGRLKTDKLIEAILEAEVPDNLSEDAGNIATALAEAAVKEEEESMEAQDLKATPPAGRGSSGDVAPGMYGSPGNVNGSPTKILSSPLTSSSRKVSSSDSLQRPASPTNLMSNLSLNEKEGSERPKKERVKKKKLPGEKNQLVGRMIQPKNAVMCLNELCPNASYTSEQEAGVPFCIAVEVFGKTYCGYGTSKQLAKQAAAEAALASFVQPPSVTSPAVKKGKDNDSDKENAVNSETKIESNEMNESTVSEEGGKPMAIDNSTEPISQGEVKKANNRRKQQITDATPWATIASFALHKLFHNWRDGRVGEQPQIPPYGIPFGTPVMPPTFGGPLISPIKGNQTSFVQMGSPQSPHVNSTSNEAITAYLGGRAPKVPVGEPTKVPQPAKQLPDDAEKMHPVMLLHQMRPTVKYNIVSSTQDNKPYYTLTSEIDGQTFTGEGLRVKRAKFFLAKDAIEKLFGVTTTMELPA